MEKLDDIEPPCKEPKNHRERSPKLPVFFCRYDKKVECPYRVELTIVPGEYACVHREE